MESIKFACPKCGKQYAVPPARAGVEGPCLQCGERIRVPNPAEAMAPTRLRVGTDRRTGPGRRKAQVPIPFPDRRSGQDRRSEPAGEATETHAADGKPFGRYRLQKELGHGGMGIVWKAWDTQLKRVVALKQILARGEEDKEQIERFMREARLAAKLRHPHIIAVYDVGEHQGQHYFTCEFVEGRSLEEAMKGRLTPNEGLAWVRGVAEALAYAHGQGVIHRDVKPANVLIDGNGQPFVMDFGLAKEVDLATKEGARMATLTAEGAVLGTPMYMSPEQVSGRALGPATDQFSLGVMLYQVLTGRLPFQGRSLGELFISIMRHDPPSPSKVSPRVHRDLDTICLKALEKDAKKRYVSMADLAVDLGRHLDGEPILARPISMAERLWRAARKHKTVLLYRVTAWVLGAAAVAATASLILARREKEATAVGRQGDLEDALERARVAELGARSVEGPMAKKPYMTALEAFKEALTIDPGSAAAKEGRNRVEVKLASLNEAANRETQAQGEALSFLEMARAPLDQALLYRRSKDADSEQLVEKVKVAQQLIEDAIKRAPNLALGHYLLGRAWNLRGAEEDAQACWRKAGSLDPQMNRLTRSEMLRIDMRRTFVNSIEKSEKEREACDAFHADCVDFTGATPIDKTGILSWALWEGATDDALLPDVAGVVKAYLSGNGDKGAELARIAIEQHGDTDGVEDFYWLGGVLASSPEDRRDSIDLLNRAIANRPAFAILWYWRGFHRCQSGDYDGAIADFDEADRRRPRFAAALRQRAVARAAQGDFAKAIADLGEALKVDDPANAAADIFRRGDVRSAQHDTAGANADCIQAFVDCGKAHLDHGMNARAITDFDKALMIEPRTAPVLVLRGGARCRMALGVGSKRWDEAQKALVGGDDEAARKIYAEAIADYDKALEIDPSLADALLGRGGARALGTHDLEGAVADYDAALRIDPRLSAAWFGRGGIRGENGDLDGAIADIEKAIELNRDPGQRSTLDYALAYFREKKAKLK